MEPEKRFARIDQSVDPKDPDDPEASVGQAARLENDLLEGRYVNYFQIGNNVFEFLIEFGQMYEGKQERIHSRMVMNPANAKELFRVLGHSITTYEEKFGPIGEI